MRKILLIGCLSLLVQLGLAQVVHFIENKGQWDEQILFKSSFKGGNLWVQKSKLFFHLKDFAALRENHAGKTCDTFLGLTGVTAVSSLTGATTLDFGDIGKISLPLLAFSLFPNMFASLLISIFLPL